MSVEGREGKLPEWATKIHQEYGEPKLSELQDVFLGPLASATLSQVLRSPKCYALLNATLS